MSASTVVMTTHVSGRTIAQSGVQFLSTLGLYAVAYVCFAFVWHIVISHIDRSLEQDTSFVYALSIVFYLIVVADMSKEAVRLLKAVVVGDATAWQLRKIGDEYAFLLMWPRAKRAWVDAVGKQARERDVLIE